MYRIIIKDIIKKEIVPPCLSLAKRGIQVRVFLEEVVNANICFNKRNGNTDREEYFDQELYNQKYTIERTNTWMDSFRSLLNRFDTTVAS